METKILDSYTLKRVLRGGAQGISENIEVINDLNVFPVPDGDTGTNMSKTIDGGIAKLSASENESLSQVAGSFSRGTLLGARGNSGVILSQFFAGMCEALVGKETATAKELAEAYMAGVARAYKSVATPVEGTILTVLRESCAYASEHINGDTSLEEFLRLHIEEAERSLARTKDILPVLTQADVVDSGGAGYLCIAKGMYDALNGKPISVSVTPTESVKEEIDYDLFTTDSTLTYGYCTECLVRLQRAKQEPDAFDTNAFVEKLTAMDCDSIVALRDGDILKVHAHTKTPSDILVLCQTFGEFLNIKIENMSLQHSERIERAQTKRPPKPYGIITVATGEGMSALFKNLGADAVINGGQTGNPAAEQFLDAFESINADQILVFPNNSNILLTAQQAAELWGKGNVTVVPTKTLPQGYSALSVFNAAIESLDDQVEALTEAIGAVASAEVTVAIRDSALGGMDIHEGNYIGILDGKLTATADNLTDALLNTLHSIPDIDDREIITLFTGAGVSDALCSEVTEALEDAFPDCAVEVYVGGQDVYHFLVAVE